MTPTYSDDQPDKPDKQPVEQDGVHRFAVSQEMLYRIRKQKAVPIMEDEYHRFIRNVRGLESSSSNWLAAGWALAGIAVSLAGIALTISGQLLTFGGFALLCALGMLGCFLAGRQLNRKQNDAAETLALEMEEAGDGDRIEILPLRPDENTPPAGSSP